MFVDARVVGSPAAGVTVREIPYAPTPAVSLRSLIDHVVREEVSSFADRERQRRFVRVLTGADISRGLQVGKIDPSDHPPGHPVDPDAAVRTSLEAFTDGLYFVFVGDRQVESLDDEVAVGPSTRVRFLRLTALAGG